MDKQRAYALVVIPFYTEEQRAAMQISHDPWRNLQREIENKGNDNVCVPRDWFAIVHRGQVTDSSVEESLRQLFHSFNQEELPELYRGPSLSTGHFVWLADEDNDDKTGTFWLCTWNGWQAWTGWGNTLALLRDCTHDSHQPVISQEQEPSTL
jgi:hypothetical protein